MNKGTRPKRSASHDEEGPDHRKVACCELFLNSGFGPQESGKTHRICWMATLIVYYLQSSQQPCLPGRFMHLHFTDVETKARADGGRTPDVRQTPSWWVVGPSFSPWVFRPPPHSKPHCFLVDTAADLKGDGTGDEQQGRLSAEWFTSHCFKYL